MAHHHELPAGQESHQLPIRTSTEQGQPGPRTPSRGRESTTSLNVPTSRSNSEVPFSFGAYLPNSPGASPGFTFTVRQLHNATPNPSPRPYSNPGAAILGTPASSDSDISSIQETPSASQPTSQSVELPVRPLFSPPQGTNDSSFSRQPLTDQIADNGLMPDAGAFEKIPAPLGPSPVLFNAAPSEVVTAPAEAPILNVDAAPAATPPTSEGDLIPAFGSGPVPYSVDDEPMPTHQLFDRPFQRLLQRGKEVAKNISSALNTYDVGSTARPDLQNLLQTSRKCVDFSATDTRTIAVLGDSGEGKSSLINSLLHCPGIAKTGDIGSACTAVATEYRYKRDIDFAPYTIEVEYLSKDKIEDLIKELIWSYRQVFLIENDDESKEGAEEFRHREAESGIAWSALNAAFGHQRRLLELLNDKADGAHEKAIRTVLEWAKDIVWPESGQDGTWRSTAQSAEECCDHTDHFMSDKLWPFTKVIRVFLKAQVLKTGVVLADLPGLHDVNLAKVKATEQYLFKCHHIFVVSKISRAISDQSLKSSLFEALKRHIPYEWDQKGASRLNVTIVCTRSDDMDEASIKKAFVGQGKAIDPAVMEDLNLRRMQAKARRDKGAKKQCKREEKQLLMAARNEYVMTGLQRSYAAKVPGGKLDIHCIANSDYIKYSRRGDSQSVIASGIPGLRRCCHSISADAQFMESKNFLLATIPSLVASAQLWVESLKAASTGPSEQLIAQKTRALNEARSKAQNSVKDATISLTDVFREQLFDLSSHRLDHWKGAAKQESRVWDSWHWASYKAFCNHNGTHMTPATGNVLIRWNDLLIWKMRSEQQLPWYLIEEEVPTIFEDLKDSLKKHLTGLSGEFADVPSFAESVKLRIGSLVYSLEMWKRQFLEEIGIIRRNLSEDNISSYILNGMLPAYRNAQQQRDTGSAQRRRDAIHYQISNGLFEGISICAANAITDVIETMQRLAREDVNSVFEQIKTDFDMVYRALPPSEPAVSAKVLDDLAAKLAAWQEEKTAIMTATKRHGGGGGSGGGSRA